MIRSLQFSDMNVSKQGVTLYTKDGQFNLSNPQDKLMKMILDGMGEFENSIRAERTRLGKLNRAREGLVWWTTTVRIQVSR